MYCRVLRLKFDPAKTEPTIDGFTNKILPALKRETGFAGATLVGNRMTGEGLSVAYFGTEHQVIDSRDRVRVEGLKYLAEVGGSILEEDVCEVTVMERFQPPKSGAFVRVTSVQADPAKLPEAVANFKDVIVPALHKQPGVRAAFFFANQKAGKAFFGSLWNTRADLDQSEPAMRTLRAESIAKASGKDAKTEIYEIYATEILVPAGALAS